jgi:hypothetical protein
MNVGIYEGAFSSRPIAQNLELFAPFASVLAGPGGFRAAPGGTIQGRLGWGNPATGLVSNTRITAADGLGVVIPLRSINASNGGVIGGARGLAGPQASSTWEFFDRTVGAWRIREGLVVTLMRSGNFWLKFAGGAIYGNQVYASLAGDGAAISGPADNAELTPFYVCSQAAPGKLAKVSTSAIFSA